LTGMNVNEEYRKRLKNVGEALDLIRPGNRIFLTSGPAVPPYMVTEMFGSKKGNLYDLELIQLVSIGEYIARDSSHKSKYRLKTFNIGQSISSEILQGRVDFIPTHINDIPAIFSSGVIGVDIAVIQVSPPDRQGYFSLGIASDVAKKVIRRAPVVIAEVNTRMPWTYGDTLVHMGQVHHIVESDMPLPVRKPRKFDSVQERIGWHVSNLIQDGSTVVLHVGSIFDAIAYHLRSKKDLGILTNVVSDWVMELIESGAISPDRSRVEGGKVTTSYCYGTEGLYEYIDHNLIFEFYPHTHLANPINTKRVSNLVSIMNVKRIDISGESVIFFSGDNFLSGYESKLNFAIEASYTKKGKSMAVLKSIDMDGRSNIVISHADEPEQARTTLGTTRYVVTEYGVADLFGRSIRERVLAMIDIAHPDHREKLLDQAKELGYVYPDQIYILDHAIHYPDELETVKSFRDGLEVRFRPIKPADEDMMRRLFYDFSDESKYFRYFNKVLFMPHRDMQKYVNIDYDKTVSIVGLVNDAGRERIIAEARYSLYEKEGSYEMAFIVDEQFHGSGIASFMLKYLFMIAGERGIRELNACVLAENRKMMDVFNRAEIKPETRVEEGSILLTFRL